MARACLSCSRLVPAGRLLRIEVTVVTWPWMDDSWARMSAGDEVPPVLGRGRPMLGRSVVGRAGRGGKPAARGRPSSEKGIVSKTGSNTVQEDGRLTSDGEDGCYSLEDRLERGDDVSGLCWDGNRWQSRDLSSIDLGVDLGIDFVGVQSCLFEVNLVDG